MFKSHDSVSAIELYRQVKLKPAIEFVNGFLGASTNMDFLGLPREYQILQTGGIGKPSTSDQRRASAASSSSGLIGSCRCRLRGSSSASWSNVGGILSREDRVEQMPAFSCDMSISCIYPKSITYYPNVKSIRIWFQLPRNKHYMNVYLKPHSEKFHTYRWVLLMLELH